MSSLSNERMERAQDLIIARATIGLSPAEGEELRELMLEMPAAEVGELEQAVEATRAALAAQSGNESLPAMLRDRVVAGAPLMTGVVGRLPDTRAVPGGRSARVAWMAAAACLLIGGAAVMISQPWARSSAPRVDLTVIEGSPDVVRWAFKPSVPGFQGASGEVVWSGRMQRGYMRLKGVEANDPKVKQYQLWIVDPARDERPVDGGVFDVAGTGEVIVPFESRLNVPGPGAFAITAEKPGGVVVSGGPLLMVAAKPG